MLKRIKLIKIKFLKNKQYISFRTATMEKKFRKGEIVWAKVRGFPWWPAMVKSQSGNSSRNEVNEIESDSKEASLVVYFIGDDSHADLPVSKVEKFAPKLEEYSKTKKRSLLNSINLAKKILSGEIPFEKHLQFSKRRNRKIDEEKQEDEEEMSRMNSSNLLMVN